MDFTLGCFKVVGYIVLLYDCSFEWMRLLFLRYDCLEDSFDLIAIGVINNWILKRNISFMFIRLTYKVLVIPLLQVWF